jgi:Saxitoxin biosynthesis operon protein SxtJ
MSHEDLSREDEVEGSSDRSFGFVFAVVFLIIAAWPLLYSAGPRWWSVGVAAAFALVAIVKPVLLAGANKLWMKFGLLLAKVVSPIALGILFYLVFMPIGLLMRVTGKDPLRLKFDPAAQSYWIPREPPGPPPTSMTNQF